MTTLIERNTTIPTRRTEVFTTAEDNQPSVEIHVLQGEREMASYNKTLGKFQLVDLPPAPRGVPQIEVTFDIDANGIVHVSAKDRATSKEQSMTITGQSSLNKDDINRMVKDAEAHAEEDRKRREEAEVRNNADTLVYQTEKVLREQGDKVSADEKAAVEAPLADLKSALGGSDVEAIKSATEHAHDGQPELQPEALRGRRPRRQRGRHLGLRPGRRRPVPRRRRRRDRRRRDRRRRTSERGARPRRAADGTEQPSAEPMPTGTGSAPGQVDAAAVHRRSPSRRQDGTPSDAEDAERLVEHDIASLLNERDQFKDIALRLQADFENYRKRADRQVADERRAGHRPAGRRAAARCSTPARPRSPTAPTDVEPIWSALLGTLQSQGLEVMDPMDKPFDPTEQEAVLHEPGDAVGEPVVAEVFRTGYRWKGKVAAAAMVKVKG